jgi:hypothetical protein
MVMCAILLSLLVTCLCYLALSPCPDAVDSMR